MNKIDITKLNLKIKETEALKDGESYVLDLENIDKVYDNGFQAIFGTNIKLKRGEFLALLGPSGCGKSTTLRMIAGLEEVSQGDIYINNVNVTNAEPANRNITMVFQNYALFPHLSVKDNIAFGLNSNKKKLGESGKLYKEINVMKAEIAAKEQLIKNIEKIEKYKENLVKLETKLEVAKTKYQNLLKEDVNKENKNTKKARADVIKLDALISANKSKITKFELEKNNITSLKMRIQELDTKAAELEVQRKEMYKNEDKDSFIENKIKEAAEILGLDHLLDRKPAQLSGGQRQRIALGRSIVGNPTLFLMDEPLSNLDAKLRQRMRQEIRELHKKINSGTVYVTHDQIEAMTMADKIAVMADGFVLQIGSPNEVFKNPACLFVASFVGTPEMNLIEGIKQGEKFISNNGLEIEIPSYKYDNVKEGQKIVLGIRPNDFSVDSSTYEAYNTKVEVKIISKELLGNEIQYSAEIVSSKEVKDKITFITNSYENYEINSIKEIYPIMSRIHIFDQETTIALTSTLNRETIQALNNWINAEEKIAIRREILEDAKKRANKKGFFTRLKENKRKK